jgi:hypothetical protein
MVYIKVSKIRQTHLWVKCAVKHRNVLIDEEIRIGELVWLVGRSPIIDDQVLSSTTTYVLARKCSRMTWGLFTDTDAIYL